jgi:type IV secretion system protein VirB2
MQTVLAECFDRASGIGREGGRSGGRCGRPCPATTAATSPPASATATCARSWSPHAPFPPPNRRRRYENPRIDPARRAGPGRHRCRRLLSQAALAQGFDKINTTVTNVNTILVTISIAVVTIAIIWAGFKMIFQGARLADVANVLIGGTLVGGAAAFASYIVT